MAIHIEKSFKCNDEAKEFLTHGNDLNVLQLSTEEYVYKLQLLKFESLTLSRRFVSNQTLISGSIINDSIVLGIQSPSSACHINGQEISSRVLPICAPSEELAILYPNNYTIIVLNINLSSVKEYVEEEQLFFLMTHAFQLRSLKSENLHAQQFNTNYFSICSYILDNYQHIGQQAMMDFEQTLINDFSNLLIKTNSCKFPLSLQPQQRSKIVNRALKFIHDANYINFNISTIAQNAYCSVRTLEYAFKQVLSITPKQYMIMKRLHFINAELSTGKNVLIKDVLTKYGVTNLGRFSQDYFKLFGEYPRETVNNSHSL